MTRSFRDAVELAVLGLPLLLLAGAAATLLYGRTLPRGEALALAARQAMVIAAVAVIGLFTLLPNGGPRSGIINWLPLVHTSQTAQWNGELAVVEVLANVMLFVPLGIALAVNGVRARRGVSIGAGFSVAVEFLQLTVVGGRSVSVDDVLANTLGVAVAYGLVAVGRRLSSA